ncbi:MAG: alpha/beta hydrolase-fold protein [Candidatus Cohnella colombiensis]|uniref:Alpha/beta hydrolase-fold protein n=1 Tax=Candidatus Cohnella colombiensis TaxID=3121368 RepID=A0AA95JGX7_9BACL|nr:MAG: alpha/beta hydrolase-fold protein [Cohnella sp.]
MSNNPLFKRTIHKHEVPSYILSEQTRSIRVYLPPGYQPWISYPVVYCQDGEDFFNFGRIATHTQKLILENDWEPYIIVGVDVDKKLRTAEYSPDGDRNERYVKFFAEELVPWMETNYPVRDDPTDRILAGDSLGGTVSLSIALRYPSMFHRIISLSGAFYDVSIEEIKQAHTLSHLHMWMNVGLQENNFSSDRGTFDFVALNRMAKQELTLKGAKIKYIEKDGEHKWGFWQVELPDALGAFLGPTPHRFE